MTPEEKKKVVTNIMNKSYMNYDDEGENTISFTTRDNGDVGGEEHGDEDYIHAEKMAKEILSVLPNDFNRKDMEVETCDEWVSLIVRIK